MPYIKQLRPDKLYLPKGWVRSKVQEKTRMDVHQLSPKYKLVQRNKRAAEVQA